MTTMKDSLFIKTTLLVQEKIMLLYNDESSMRYRNSKCAYIPYGLIGWKNIQVSLRHNLPRPRNGLRTSIRRSLTRISGTRHPRCQLLVWLLTTLQPERKTSKVNHITNGTLQEISLSPSLFNYYTINYYN